MSIENPEKYKEFKTETLIDVINSCSFTVENYKRFIQEKSDYLDKSFSVDHITHLLLARSQLNDSIVTSVSEKFFKQNKKSINVVAVGGYGRNELHPYSDTDLLLLIDKNKKKVFELLNIGSNEARVKFGFLLDALSYGAPPHGGIALGFDRIMMFLLKTDSIRDVIAFPKTQKAACLLTEAPSVVDTAQLDELHIRLKASAQSQHR